MKLSDELMNSDNCGSLKMWKGTTKCWQQIKTDTAISNINQRKQ